VEDPTLSSKKKTPPEIDVVGTPQVSHESDLVGTFPFLFPFYLQYFSTCEALLIKAHASPCVL
jgi:hypothetical protein